MWEKAWVTVLNLLPHLPRLREATEQESLYPQNHIQAVGIMFFLNECYSAIANPQLALRSLAAFQLLACSFHYITAHNLVFSHL